MSELAKHYDLAKHHAHVGRSLLTLSPEKAQIWLDLIEETGRTPEGLGAAGHFLFIGRK